MKTALMLHFGDDGIRGSEVCFIESVKALRAAGWLVVVARNQPPIDPFVGPHAEAIEPLEYPELRIWGARSRLPIWPYVRSWRHLRALITRWQPNLIYANSGLPCQLAVPVGRRTRVPVLCHFHHPAIRRSYYTWLVNFADAVFFPSEYTRQHSRRKAGIDGPVLHNGVDTDVFRPLEVRGGGLRARLGLKDAEIVVGQVGALVPHKRPQLLLRCFANMADRYPQVHLCLVGKGPMEAELRQRVVALHLSGRVTITGAVDEVLPYLQQVLDINVLASVEEGLGLSIIEGSAAALPAVIADGTGLRETVVPGETGLVFTPDSEAELTDRLEQLVGDAELRRRLGSAGRVMACHHFSLSAYHRGVVDFVEATAARRSLVAMNAGAPRRETAPEREH
jgi:glycosyltransferase involved in cell wall biosynthesis